VLEHLRSLGFEVDAGSRGLLTLRAPEGKDALRRLHAEARRFILRGHQEWIRWAWPRLSPYFARGEQIIPERIRPVLVEVVEP
jgi:hypothetical protein